MRDRHDPQRHERHRKRIEAVAARKAAGTPKRPRQGNSLKRNGPRP